MNGPWNHARAEWQQHVERKLVKLRKCHQHLVGVRIDGDGLFDMGPIDRMIADTVSNIAEYEAEVNAKINGDNLN